MRSSHIVIILENHNISPRGNQYS